MRQSATSVNSTNMQSDRDTSIPYGRTWLFGAARFAMAWVLAFCFIAVYGASAQTETDSVGAQNTSQPPTGSAINTSTSPADNAQLSNVAGLTPPVLSSDRIIEILQQSPALVQELKSQLADRLQQQGIEIDPADISDEMLYRQIAANPSLRASITAVLRARGYVSDADLNSSAASVAQNERPSSRFPESDFSSMMNDTNVIGDDEALHAADSFSRIEGNGLPIASAQPSLSGLHSQRPLAAPRLGETGNASTDLPKVLHQPAPYNLKSMRDLYTQIPDVVPHLKRFGSDVFVNRDLSATTNEIAGRATPLDVPLGPDYIVGPGDTLTIDLWGGITRAITRTVDRDGRIFLPEAGSLDVAGLPLAKAQDLIENALKRQYRGAEVTVTVSNLRSVRVYVVGDVQRPGGYDISALATPLSALYAAGGPTAVGSLRILLHYRGKRLIETVDLYDFLLHGIRNGSAPFQSGDTLLIPPAGPQVAIFGAVKRPAIYELKSGETALATVIGDAGGPTAAASMGHIRIERIDAQHRRVTLSVPTDRSHNIEADQAAIAAFPVKDGDRIHIEPILPYSQRAVYLAGHIVRPGRLPYTDGMRLSDVLRSYRDMLPEPAARGEIVRLLPPDLHAEIIAFNVADVMIGNSNIALRPFDTIRIFGRYRVDAPTVTIRGEVLRPGKYPMSKGMTAVQLVRMAGGFKRDALLQSADLASYKIENGNRVVENISTIPIGAAVAGTSPDADVLLKSGDILAIHQITNWNNIGESVTIRGQVRYPGSYGFHDGERLSSVLRRAGGMLSTAYPLGAVLTRVQVRELQQKSRDELVREIETNSAAARLSPNLASANSGAALQLIKAQQEEVLADLKNHPPSGRMVIHIAANIDQWANTPADIELRRGDVLTIPKRPGFVLVTGQVYNATALTFTPGKTAGWYLSHAGGTNSTANRKEVFVIRANGSVIGRRSDRWFNGGVLSTRLNPGDVVVVPRKIIGASLFWRNLLTVGQLAASTAITAGIAIGGL